jgi:hypothetical protein
MLPAVFQIFHSVKVIKNSKETVVQSNSVHEIH